MSNQVIITIAAGPNKGKTTIARIVEAALRDNGFTNIEVQDQPQSDAPKEPIAQRFEAAKKRPIKIKVETARDDETKPETPTSLGSIQP